MEMMLHAQTMNAKRQFKSTLESLSEYRTKDFLVLKLLINLTIKAYQGARKVSLKSLFCLCFVLAECFRLHKCITDHRALKKGLKV